MRHTQEVKLTLWEPGHTFFIRVCQAAVGYWGDSGDDERSPTKCKYCLVLARVCLFFSFSFLKLVIARPASPLSSRVLIESFLKERPLARFLVTTCCSLLYREVWGNAPLVYFLKPGQCAALLTNQPSICISSWRLNADVCMWIWCACQLQETLDKESDWNFKWNDVHEFCNFLSEWTIKTQKDLFFFQ